MTDSAAGSDFATSGTNRTAPSQGRTGPNHIAVVNKIRDLFPRDTVKCLAVWLKSSVETARHRIKCDREFSLDDIVKLLHDPHGFQILKALMDRAERKPRWWLACEPLMELADVERMAAEARRRVRQAVHNREGLIDALEAEIRRAQAAALHDEEFARAHVDALRAMAGMVAAKRG